MLRNPDAKSSKNSQLETVQRAEVMLKNKQKIDGLKKKAKRMMDAENKKQAMQAAGDFEESTLKEMLKLRANMMLGGIDVEQLKGPIAQVLSRNVMP